jgi:uncharacterized protein (DUF697 family)
MPGIQDLSSVWKNIKEIDLRPIQEAALQPLNITLVGRPASGRHIMAEQMRSDPKRAGVHTQSTLTILDCEAADLAINAELIILVVDMTAGQHDLEQQLYQRWIDAGKKLVLLGNQNLPSSNEQARAQQINWPTADMLYGSVDDEDFLLREFVPRVLALLPGKHLALGRQFPLFRTVIANQLINDICFSNAAYALSTGIAEVVPVLDLPLNITDMIVLTKAQAFLVYRLGLLLGYSTNWQDYLVEFSSVIGGGFAWRQLARQLVGLIPVWGIVPKVAVSYAGTYAVGHAVLQWYLTGKHLTRQQMTAIYRQAFARGKHTAKELLARVPRPQLPRPRLPRPRLPRPRQPAALPENAGSKLCPYCSKPNSTDARFCQYCGRDLGTGEAASE